MSELMQQEAQITQMLNETPEGLPDVRGWALMDALAVLENLGLTVEVRGRGSIMEQSPKPGTALGQTQKVTLIGS